MKLTIVRHGEAEGNRQKIVMGNSDVGLTDHGREQAKAIAKQLAGRSFDKIYSSPLSRAFDTVKPLADQNHQKIIVDQRLEEVNWGSFIGQPGEIMFKALGTELDFLYYGYDLRPYGGESAEQVRDRVASFINDLKKTDDKTVLIGTHDGTLHWFYYLLNGQKAGLLPNASIHEFNL